VTNRASTPSGGRRGRRSAVTTALLLPASAWFLFLLIVPLLILLIFSVGARAPVGGYTPALQLDNYIELPARRPPRGHRLMAALGTILCMLVGYPLAYYLATRAGTKRTLLLILVVVPFWTSFLIRTYAWMTILGNAGLPAIVEGLGFGHVTFLNTPGAVMVGIVYNYLPLMVFPLYVSLERLDKRLLEASKDLGAGRIATFRQVTLPLSAAGLLSGAILVFIPLMGEYLIPALLGGGKVFFVGNALVDLFLQSNHQISRLNRPHRHHPDRRGDLPRFDPRPVNERSHSVTASPAGPIAGAVVALAVGSIAPSSGRS
jgi:spermidine/putrescine transport system permease protein